MKTSKVMRVTRMGAAAGVLTLLSLGAAQAQSFNFGFSGINQRQPPVNPGDSVNGLTMNPEGFPVQGPAPLTVTFADSSAIGGNPGNFQFTDNNAPTNPNDPPTTGPATFGTNLNGYAIVGGGPDVLTLTFSQALSGLTIQFATTDALNVTLAGGGVTDTETGTPTGGTVPLNPNGAQGLLSVFAGPNGATTFTITGTSGDFYVDNFTARVLPGVAVPEPGMVGLGLAGAITTIGLLRRKRRK